MANLRILDINAADSRTVKVRFSAALAADIGQSNIQILSEVVNIPDVEVLLVEVSDDILIITTLPQTPLARYRIVFQSTNAVKFRSLDERQFLLEDGRTNIAKVLGAENDYNPIRDNLVTFLGGQQSVYDLSRETIIRSILNQTADLLNKAQSDVRQVKSSNYLEILIKDEVKTRSFGPWDRLNQEGAFKIWRVGAGPTNETINGVITFDSFPSDPITLQRDVVTDEQLVLGIGNGTYNDLILTLNRTPVTKLTGITIQYFAGGTFVYDIRSLGYQIKDQKYDTMFGRRLITLADNQIKLNDILKEDPSFVLPSGNDKIVVSYEFKSLGRVVDETSIEVVEVVEVVREASPAIITMFSLKNAPIVTSGDKNPISGGVQFLDPYSETPFRNTHPAFLREIPYREGGLPNYPGEYSIDYATGRIFVYGAVKNDGTGDFPPAMNYYYRKTYIPRLDYTYVPEFIDIVASPLRELVTKTAKINYLFEQTYVPDIDYVANVHVESLNERIQNRLATLDSLYTLHSPVTDVFRIYNETTGEIYSLRRFSDQKIFFDSRTPPRITDINFERASFTPVLNETLILESESTNILGTRVLKIRIENQNIMGNTDDVIGSSFNTSVGFSQTDIFIKELYYDAQELSEAVNINRLLIGQYQINYRAGLIYVGVTNSQSLSIGTVSYKIPVVAPINPHVISVSEVYNSINPNFGPSKTLDYTGFGEAFITPTPSLMDFSDERFTNKDSLNSYFVYSGTITVTDDIKTIRGIFDGYDLNNHTDPLNFAEHSTFSANVITLGSVDQTCSTIISGSLTITVPFVSAGIEIGSVTSIIRTSDGAQLVDGYTNFLGNVIYLNGDIAVPGDAVDVQYTVVMNGEATPIIDYNRGDFFINYSSVTDEILISYEWGDNVIDHRTSNILNEGDTYYVTYSIGALRNSLLQNFGTLVQIPELQVFDEDLDREIYRDILQGALQTFPLGPTIPAMKELIARVTQIDPEIVEAAFWSLGVSYLAKVPSGVLGTPYLASGFFDQGFAVTKAGDGATLPISNNLRLEEGTLELSVMTDWDGIDNDATITFELLKDGYVVPAENIYIGSKCYHPTLTSAGKFSINRTDEHSPEGLPALIFVCTGIFIYYDTDIKHWKVLAKDAPDGYVYTGTITTSGSFYDVNLIQSINEETDFVRSGLDKVEFEFRLDGYDMASPDGYDGYSAVIPGTSFDGIQFMSDDQHYFFDFGKNETQNRFSLYKDGRGYLIFEVWDRGGFGLIQPDRRNVYQISADIQNWAAGQKHSIGISWILNSSDRRDEMHLYVDGQETPNLARYGNVPDVASYNRFRTVVPEQIVGVAFNNSIIGNDLVTIQGSNLVMSPSVNLSSLDDGYKIDILEQNFLTYVISMASGTQMTLNAPMPASLNNARFIINPPQFVVGTEIDIYKNIGVFVRDGYGVEREIPGTRAEIPSYSIDRNTLNQRIITIFDNVNAGDIVLIKTFGLNHRRSKDRVFTWSGSSILKTGLPPPINLDDVSIKTVILPLSSVGPGNADFIDGYFTTTFGGVELSYLVDDLGNYLIDDFGNFFVSEQGINLVDAFGNFIIDSFGNFISIGGAETSIIEISFTQPSNYIEGRQLEIRITGDNVDFTTPAIVIISGTSTISPSETLTFTKPGKQKTISKWKRVESIFVKVVPIDSTDDSVAIEVKEAYSVTEPDGNSLYPVIRFAYKTQAGGSLRSDGYGDFTIVSDPFGYFPASEVGQLLKITYPISAIGIYTIVERIDNTTIRLDRSVGGYFENGSYVTYNISIGRSGFQNGFIFLEKAGFTNDPYTLPPGWYDVDYASYLEVPFNPLTSEIGIIGNDITFSKPAKSILDEFRILSRQLTDTRIGETIGLNEESITTGATKVSPFIKNIDTLALFHFDKLPLVNDSDFYQFANKEYIQSGSSVNSRFGHSIVIKDKGLVFDNGGLLDTSNEGLIEFWVSPRYDTYNDPGIRVYFDAAANVIEETVSITKGRLKLSTRTNRILYVRLVTDTKLQGTNYFNGGIIDSDGKTLLLNSPLPYQNTPVKVAYVPSGVRGDRLTISKDGEGFICLTVNANGQEYQTRQPIFWPRDSWHRVRASFKFNRQDNKDEIRLFVDGEERGTLLFGQNGILFGQDLIWGQAAIGGVGNQIYRADINFTDTVQQFSVGQDFAGNFGAQARFDNLKISNRSIDPLIIAGQPRDIYYNTNIDFIYPSIVDAFTTFLLDFDKSVEKTEDFSVIHDPTFGLFNFGINIIDSFNIVTGDLRVQTVLEALINALKPAISKVGIQYVK
ncbi:hypothetical protein M0R72_02435 [Candidatus Pacearchaeota archaeon]|jgi:hypothetical protein|nr:hypothetical protein [Candidatus Pacearchaeota archaeon]